MRNASSLALGCLECCRQRQSRRGREFVYREAACSCHRMTGNVDNADVVWRNPRASVFTSTSPESRHIAHGSKFLRVQ